jgi:DDE family transposase
MPRRHRRLSSTSTPPTTRCTGIRKAASSTAITTITATCRFTSFAAGICWRPNCAGSVAEVSRVVTDIRKRWPAVRILLRADAGFARDSLMAWCENNGIDFLFGLAKNDRLKGRSPSQRRRQWKRWFKPPLRRKCRDNGDDRRRYGGSALEMWVSARVERVG